MKEIHEKYVLLNGSIKETSQVNHSFITQNTSVYEVIRVMDGVPLFLEEHIDRLINSCQLLGYDFHIDEEELISDVYMLISLNDCDNKNFKIVISNIESNKPNQILFFIESTYPSLENYHNGVHTILYKGERDNPNAKVIRTSFRETIKESLVEQKAYEALLVNKSEEITEGSRSNIFFVKDNILYTSPAKDVLKGVTRTRIIDLCEELNITLVEKNIPVDFLHEVEGIFMTGTSPKVLPITSVNNLTFKSTNHPLINKIINEYNALIATYISENTL